MNDLQFSSSMKLPLAAMFQTYKILATLGIFFSFFSSIHCEDVVGNVTTLPHRRVGGPLERPGGIAIAPGGNILYVSNTQKSELRKIYLKKKKSERLQPDDRMFLAKVKQYDSFGKEIPKKSRDLTRPRRTIVISKDYKFPKGLSLDHQRQCLYVVDTFSYRINQLNLTTGESKTLPGYYMSPSSVAADLRSEYIYITNDMSNVISLVNVETDEFRNWPNNENATHFEHPQHVSVDPNGMFFLVCETVLHQIRKVGIYDGTDIILPGTFHYPAATVMDPSGSFIYVADSGNHVIKRIDISNWDTIIIAGQLDPVQPLSMLDGVGTYAKFKHISDLVIDDLGKHLFVVDGIADVVRKIELIPVAHSPIGEFETNAASDDSLGEEL